jgi:type III pantothenate kinase
MVLVLDIGNTNIKAGLFNGDKLLNSMRLTSSANKTSDEYWLLLRDILFVQSGFDVKGVSGAIISSVNPNLNYTLEHMVSYYLNVTPLIVGGGIKCGLNIKYDNPKEVGGDRIVGSLAAFNTYGGPCIVVDCGTATTFNVISQNGEFLGGPISFGLKEAADGLSKSAAKLPKIELVFPQNVVNKTTTLNMQSGILYGYVGMIEYIVDKIKREANIPSAKVVGTGGISEMVGKNSDVFDVFDRTLTLRGLNMIYKMNKNK